MRDTRHRWCRLHRIASRGRPARSRRRRGHSRTICAVARSPWVAEALRRGASCTSPTCGPHAVRDAFKAPGRRRSCIWRRRSTSVVRSRIRRTTLEVNVAGTVSVLEAARRRGAPRGAGVHGGGVRGSDSRSDDRGGAGRAAVAVRDVKGCGGVVSGAVLAPVRDVDAGVADGERVRAASGPARGGRRRGDLLRARRSTGRDVEVFGDGHQTRDYVFIEDVIVPGCSGRQPTSRARSTCRPGVRQASSSWHGN